MMKLLLGFILSNVVGLFLLIFMSREARKEKVPVKVLVLMIVVGSLNMIPIIALQTIVGYVCELSLIQRHPLCQEIIMSVIRLALVEELCKFLGTKAVTWKGSYFTNSYQGLLFPAIVSLSFGILENLLFVSLSLQQFQEQYWLIVILRAFMGAPAHGAYGIIIGIFYGKAKYAAQQKDKSNQHKYLSLAVFIPVCIHGLYDWLTNSQFIKIADTSIITAIIMMIDVIVIIYSYHILYRCKSTKQTWV